ncbi:MAG: hypothetical protein R2848_15355 [Thermomicrobiales bacterium]
MTKLFNTSGSGRSPVKLVFVTGYPRYYHQLPLVRVAEADHIDLTVVYSSAGGVVPHERV